MFKKKSAAAVIDTNVIIAAAYGSGRTYSKLLLLSHEGIPLYTPYAVIEEIAKHLPYFFSRKDPTVLLTLLFDVLGMVNVVDPPEHQIKKALSYVKDAADTPFMATALHLLENAGFNEVYLITFNKKDYLSPNKKIKIVAPSEL
ncbi:MAG: hypothetical protein GXO00_01855 [Candidatus Diapherotrites archaeon]|nr:hypothetical protein [Candidatus Diapherotrites archaeon]